MALRSSSTPRSRYLHSAPLCRARRFGLAASRADGPKAERRRAPSSHQRWKLPSRSRAMRRGRRRSSSSRIELGESESRSSESGPERIVTTKQPHDERRARDARRARSGRATDDRVVRVQVGAWPSGLYFARLRAADGRVGFAPFVVRPRWLGERRVAVVLPTLTWQAYNLRDEDDDGSGDSWYATGRAKTVRLGRPYLSRGVPYNFRRYDLPFLHWLARTGEGVDVLSQSDLESAREPAPPRRGLRPHRLPRAPRVRDAPRVRPRRGLPRPRRQPHVPLARTTSSGRRRAQATRSTKTSSGAISAARRRR